MVRQQRIDERVVEFVYQQGEVGPVVLRYAVAVHDVPYDGYRLLRASLRMSSDAVVLSSVAETDDDGEGFLCFRTVKIGIPRLVETRHDALPECCDSGGIERFVCDEEVAEPTPGMEIGKQREKTLLVHRRPPFVEHGFLLWHQDEPAVAVL